MINIIYLASDSAASWFAGIIIFFAWGIPLLGMIFYAVRSRIDAADKYIEKETDILLPFLTQTI